MIILSSVSFCLQTCVHNKLLRHLEVWDGDTWCLLLIYDNIYRYTTNGLASLPKTNVKDTLPHTFNISTLALATMIEAYFYQRSIAVTNIWYSGDPNFIYTHCLTFYINQINHWIILCIQKIVYITSLKYISFFSTSETIISYNCRLF